MTGINKKAEARVHPEGNNLRMAVMVVIIIIVSLIAFYPALEGQFTSWDDNQYITSNKNMREFSWAYAGDCFTRFELGNYHPLTMISYSFNYNTNKPDPKPFILTNIFLHLFNSLMVLMIIRRLKFHDFIAFVTAVLFAIQATRVESVAWISARKEVLSAFFALGSFLSYLYYYKYSKSGYYYLSVLLFILALLSKATTVVLAPLLLLADVRLGRGLLKRAIILEKLPYFFFALLAGGIAIYAQNSIHAIQVSSPINTPERIVVGLGNILLYIKALLFPVGLAAFYRYPLTDTGGLPLLFYFYALLAVATVLLVFYFAGKSWKTDPYVFGLLFFVIGIFPVLQFIPVGEAIRADRYTYLPGIGIFLIVGVMVNALQRLRKSKGVVYAVLACIMMILTIVTRKQAECWKDDKHLFSSLIKQDPKIAVAYVIRGALNEKEGNIPGAVDDYSSAINLDSSRVAIAALNNRAVIYTWTGKFKEAESDLIQALKYDNSFEATYANMGFLMTRQERYSEAIPWLDKALHLRPDDPIALGNRGFCYLQNGEMLRSARDIEYSISLKYDNPYVWYFKACYELTKKDTSACCRALMNARMYGYSFYAGQAADSLFNAFCNAD